MGTVATFADALCAKAPIDGRQKESGIVTAMDLDRAIDEAQRRSVAVFAFYAPSVGLMRRSHLTVNFGQGSLTRIADEAGGEAFSNALTTSAT